MDELSWAQRGRFDQERRNVLLETQASKIFARSLSHTFNVHFFRMSVLLKKEGVGEPTLFLPIRKMSPTPLCHYAAMTSLLLLLKISFPFTHYMDSLNTRLNNSVFTLRLPELAMTR
jgi:hypothetical protein